VSGGDIATTKMSIGANHDFLHHTNGNNNSNRNNGNGNDDDDCEWYNPAIYRVKHERFSTAEAIAITSNRSLVCIDDASPTVASATTAMTADATTHADSPLAVYHEHNSKYH
jgi:hypothetical protein